MYFADSEELIQMEVEHLAESLYGTSYFDLSPKMKLYIRLRAMDLLWPADFRDGFIAAA